LFLGEREIPFGVDIEGHFDLRSPRRAEAMPSSLKFPNICCQRTSALALADADVNGRLVVGSRGEESAIFWQDGRVALDHRRGAEPSFRWKALAADVEKQHVLHIPAEEHRPGSQPDGDDFVRIHALVRSFPPSSRAISTTFGMRVMPPDEHEALISEAVSPASLRRLHGFWCGSKSESVSCSSLERVSVS